MSTFNQQKQKISGNQINIGGDLIIKTIHNKSDIASELKKIIAEIDKATQSKQVPLEISRNANKKLQEAIKETEKKEPNPKTILDYINGTKELISSIASTANLVTALTQVAIFASQFFHNKP